MKKKSNSNRFKVVLHETSSDEGSGTKILEDTETGITYLYYYGEDGGAGLTVLLDEEGNPAVVPER
ncbi:MAG: DUF6440 family protein [Eubacterium sp.]